MNTICNICGGELSLTEDNRSSVCPVCNTVHHPISGESEALARALARAAEYRLAHKYSLAKAEYGRIIEEYPTSPEAHLGMLLSHYEVELAVDKERGAAILTCRKIRNKEVFENENYLAALANASDEERRAYAGIAEKIADQQKALKARYKPGRTLTLGSYHQHSADYKESIEWIILARKHNKLLLISKYLLDRKPYEEYRGTATWGTSSVRGWLNSTFLNEAFSEEEQRRIASAEIITKAPRGYPSVGGEPTNDKIFLLSIEEAHKYFPSADSKRCKPTPYTVLRGAHKDSRTGYGWWWLRSPGCSNSSAAHVRCDGGVGFVGALGAIGGAIRPALWLMLEA